MLMRALLLSTTVLFSGCGLFSSNNRATSSSQLVVVVTSARGTGERLAARTIAFTRPFSEFTDRITSSLRDDWRVASKSSDAIELVRQQPDGTVAIEVSYREGQLRAIAYDRTVHPSGAAGVAAFFGFSVPRADLRPLATSALRSLEQLANSLGR